MTNKKDQVVALDPFLDLVAATPLKNSLEEALTSASPILVDAGNVEHVATPCVQLLHAARVSAENNNVSLEIVGASDAFIAALEDLGALSLFSIRSAD